MAPRGEIPPLEEQLAEFHIPVFKVVAECDHAIVLYGAYENPMPFKHSTLAYWMHNDTQFWTLGFHSFYLPVLRHYYDEFLDCTKCKTYDEVAEKVAEYVKKKQNETDQS